MSNKSIARIKRARRTRAHIKRLGIETGIARLSIYRSAQHIYVQVIAPVGGKILACASSLEKTIRESKTTESNKKDIARQVGKLLGERAKSAGIEKVASDRSGYKYHGRVAALIEAVRENIVV